MVQIQLDILNPLSTEYPAILSKGFSAKASIL